MPSDPSGAQSLGWHVISGEDLLAMLRRVAEGEDPDVAYIEECSMTAAADQAQAMTDHELGELLLSGRWTTFEVHEAGRRLRDGK